MSNLVQRFWKMVEKSDKARMAKQSFVDCATEQTDIEYTDSKHPLNLLDVYRPIGASGKLPLIIDIHGGGWWYGDKELNKNYCLKLTKESGFSVANISYRLLPEVTYFEQLRDVFKALNFLYDNAEKYEIDLNNVFLTGDSAGGFFALLTEIVLKNNELKQLFEVDSKITLNAVGLTCAVFDTTNVAKILGAGIYLKPYYGEGYRKSKFFAASNLFNYLSKDLAPMFLISAYGDFMKKQVKKGYKKLLEIGNDCALCFWEKPLIKEHKLVHVYNVLEPNWEESERTNNDMISFFKKHLK